MKKLLIKTGTYQKDGQTKNRYTQLGVIKQNDNGGEYALLDPSVDLAGALMQQNAIDPSQQARRSLLVGIFESDTQGIQSHRPSSENPASATTATPTNTGAPAQTHNQNVDAFNDDIPF